MHVSDVGKLKTTLLQGVSGRNRVLRTEFLNKGFTFDPPNPKPQRGMSILRNLFKENPFFKIAFFLAFVCVVYFPYLVGARRIFHDTFLNHFPWRVYLSDSLRSGIFPFWNPFSYPGFPSAADMGSEVYYPIAILLGALFKFDGNIYILEFVLTSSIAFWAMYAWLKHINVKSMALLLAGSVAYAGCASLVDQLPNFIFLRTMAFIPILFLGADLIATGSEKRHFLRGVLLLAISGWVMATGAYVGYTIVFFAVLFCFARFFQKVLEKWEDVRVLHSLSYGLLAAFAVVCLSFLPLSEMAAHFEGDVDNLRSKEQIDPYKGCLSTTAPVSMFLANSSYLTDHTSYIVAGAGQMYFGLALSIMLLVGFFYSRKQTLDYLLLLFGVMVLLAAMGQWSPVARFFVAYAPAFAYFRWHLFFNILPVFFFIGVSVRFLENISDQLEKGKIRKSQITIAISTCFVLAMLVGFLLLDPTKRSFGALPALSYFDLSSLALLGGSAFGVILFTIGLTIWGKRPSLRLVSFLLLSLPAGILVYWMVFSNPSVQAYLIDLFDRFDNHFMKFEQISMFGMDLVHAVLIFLGLLVFLLFSKTAGQLRWLILLLVFIDIGLGANRYFHGERHWIDSQKPRHVDRSEDFAFSQNVRFPRIDRGHMQFNSDGLMKKKPYMDSYIPSRDQRLFDLMEEMGEEPFSKLLWLLPGNASVNKKNFMDFATGPDLQSLYLTPNRLMASMDVPAAGKLVFTDNYNSGWQAKINGQEVEVLPFLTRLKCVEVPVGKVNIEFTYRPYFLREGLLLLAVGMLIIIVTSCMLMFGKP